MISTSGGRHVHWGHDAPQSFLSLRMARSPAAHDSMKQNNDNVATQYHAQSLCTNNQWAARNWQGKVRGDWGESDENLNMDET
jgi:hypothetical protein